MTTIIKFDLKELKKLANDKNSCVEEKNVTQNLALQPWCLGNLKESIKNLLDFKIGKFDKEYNGILLSYKNLHILQNVGAIRNDNADIHFQIQADYFIFRPHMGAMLKGVVNKKSNTHLGVLVHRLFNVVILKPADICNIDWIGARIEEGQKVLFEIVALDLYGALPYIQGQLDESWLDEEICEADDIKESKLLKVSYINFDKTKPNYKQTDENLQDSYILSISNNLKTNTSLNELSVTDEVENNGIKMKSKSRKQNKIEIESSPRSKKLKKS